MIAIIVAIAWILAIYLVFRRKYSGPKGKIVDENGEEQIDINLF